MDPTQAVTNSQFTTLFFPNGSQLVRGTSMPTQLATLHPDLVRCFQDDADWSESSPFIVLVRSGVGNSAIVVREQNGSESFTFGAWSMRPTGPGGTLKANSHLFDVRLNDQAITRMLLEHEQWFRSNMSESLKNAHAADPTIVPTIASGITAHQWSLLRSDTRRLALARTAPPVVERWGLKRPLANVGAGVRLGKMTDLSHPTVSGSTNPHYSYKRRRRRCPSAPAQSVLPLCCSRIALSLLLLACYLVTVVSAAPNNCLRFADYDSINQLFIDGGPGTKVYLCPSKVYRMSGTVVFTAADQELATFGYPTGADRATLRVEGDLATAVQGDCRRCARVAVRALIVDGNRAGLGRMKDVEAATGLVVLGGNQGQSVRGCWLKDPRGFTAIHVREGDKLSCSGAIIEKNEIGPAGEEYDPAVDGPDPEAAPDGRPLADGISIACRDSYVRDNAFHDCTDAAVVVYCAPGTVVHANTITTRSRSAMAGILAVDSTPFDGDYTGTTIKANIIDAARRTIRVAIGLGATVWSDDTETILKGGSVVANGLRGRFMGYGIAAAGLEGWTVTDNWDEARHQGVRSARCFDEPINPDPTAFLYHSESIRDSTFQPGFLDQEFQYLVCIDGVESSRHNVAPGAHEDLAPTAPEAAPAAPAPPAPLEGFNTGSEILDDILLHSQQRMLEALEHLSRRVDIMATDAGAGIADGAHVGPVVANALADLSDRVAALESRQAALIKIASDMRSAMRLWDGEMSALNEWQYEMLLDVQHRLGIHLATPGEPPARAHVDPGERDMPPGHRGAAGRTVNWETVSKWVVGQGIFGLGVWGVRRWSARRRHGKLS